jgi:rubrerythrin
MRPTDSPRGDALLFYSMAISSFIETTTPEYVTNLERIFRDDPLVMHWLEHTWRHEEVRHGSLMRTQLEQLWPEFEVEQAYAEFTRSYVPRCDVALLRPTPALEALARCVTEALASASYRALASYTSGPHLKAMFLGMAADEARHYSYFRRAFERYNEREKHQRLKRLQVVVTRSLLVRDEDLPIAFASLNEHWTSRPPFEQEDYAGYLRLVAHLVRNHFPVTAAARMLMQPVAAGTWLEKLAIPAIARILPSSPR